MPQKTRANWAGYFSSPEERATHSFESTFDNAMVSDVKDNSGFRYPLGPEREMHGLVWKRFFRATKAWAQDLTSSAAPSMALKEVSPELPMAARRRARLEPQAGSSFAPSPSPPSLG